MPESLREAGGSLWAVILALFGGGGLGMLFQAFRKPSSQAEMIKAAQDVAKSMMEAMAARIGSLEQDVERLKRENETCRVENERLWGENERLWEQVGSLEAAIRARNVEEAAKALPGTFATIENDRVTVLRPSRGSKPRSKE